MGFYPVEERLGTEAKQAPKAVMFVDVSGGSGHEAAALRKQHLKFPGKFFVQGLSLITSEIKQDDVEVVAPVFLTPQPFKGPRVYYLRLILHDWNDEQCDVIQSHMRDAMDPAYRKVLINQWVLPTQYLTPYMTHMHFNLMATSSAMERTEESTRNLHDRAGLKVSQILYPPDKASECYNKAVAK